MTTIKPILYKTNTMKGNFYHMVIDMAREERYKMYMEQKKEDLVRMLVERDMLEVSSPRYTEFPLDQRPSICKTWKDCTNPHMDCINCPLRYKSGGRTFATNEYKPVKDIPMEGIWY